MVQEKKLPFPPMLLLLDFIGMLLAGLGLAKLFANVDVLPEPFRFEHYGLIFLIVGFALTIPLFYFVTSKALAKKPA